jgi:hypothetical protein
MCGGAYNKFQMKIKWHFRKYNFSLTKMCEMSQLFSMQTLQNYQIFFDFNPFSRIFWPIFVQFVDHCFLRFLVPGLFLKKTFRGWVSTFENCIHIEYLYLHVTVICNKQIIKYNRSHCALLHSTALYTPKGKTPRICFTGSPQATKGKPCRVTELRGTEFTLERTCRTERNIIRRNRYIL